MDGPWRPGGWQGPLRGVTVVEVQEVSAPEGVEEPLHWVFLTSLPCASLAEARRMVGRYTARWWVEEYHKALKTEAPLLHRHYPASPLVRASPPPLTAQPVPRGLLVESSELPPCWVSRVAAGLRCAHVLTNTPAIRTRCSLRSLPAPCQPSPCFNRVGVRIALFEACSVFTHIRTCSLADSLARAFDIGSFARRRCQRPASRLLPAERKLPGGVLSPTGVLLRFRGALKHAG